MQRGQCVHFNGVQNTLCKRGVAYDQPKFAEGRPCIQFIEKTANGSTYIKPGEAVAERKPFPRATAPETCPFFEAPTDEQVQADQEESERYLQRAMLGIQVASKWRARPKPRQDRREVVECPACNGRLHLFQSSHNGHVHWKCDTEGCISWME